MNYKANQTTVMLLAAGHGKRMLPLTASTPKPLLKIAGRALIEHHIVRLAAQGFRKIVINLAYLGEQIQAYLGDGRRFGVSIHYSDESSSGALETAGGLKNALPLIESDPFLVVNADIWTDYPFAKILTPLHGLARLIVVDNPEHNANGDFSFADGGTWLNHSTPEAHSHTFGGIALYRKSIFNDVAEGALPLAPILYQLSSNKKLEGVCYRGKWVDIGTPERLQQTDKMYSSD
jgi:MurNAc alpha-1-phosphate uridylyltransferase